jgi:5-methylcytosine-specific restriction endonuclease McrA
MRQTNLYCHQCTKRYRECAGCGWTFYGSTSKCSTCRGRPARLRRRARLGDDVIEDVVYRAVIASGPCVYCGDRATTADHVRPLSSGGRHVIENLVPACRSCNSSKHAALLSAWHRQDLVAHAVAVSPVAAAEWRRLTVGP